jgi:hypothetical protein
MKTFAESIEIYHHRSPPSSNKFHGPKNSLSFKFYQQKRNEGKPAKVAL